ncbi:hypothetical protein [Pseudonocardia sp. GCM10023141]|uniref:hypothetical protein n=1 Tax=Pseudonocardia sp. GCM10023141 TaxID=3252653 RepID=UPI00361EA1BC
MGMIAAIGGGLRQKTIRSSTWDGGSAWKAGSVTTSPSTRTHPTRRWPRARSSVIPDSPNRSRTLRSATALADVATISDVAGRHRALSGNVFVGILFMDDHLIHGAVLALLALLALLGAGNTLGLGRTWTATPLVRRLHWLA